MNIHVFGLGAIGSNIISQLHKRYPDAWFHGIDFDTVEDRNIKTQAFFLEHKGKPKSAVIPSILARKDAKAQYSSTNRKMDSTKDILSIPRIKESSLILDCFDNTKSRQMIKDLGDLAPILHIGFSPHYTAEIIWNEKYLVPGEVDKDIDICELNNAVFFIHYIVNFAAMVACDFLDNGKKRNFFVTSMWKIKEI
jgi:molybdopterin/thiamine biosynthesis adenylyltransferase